MTVPATFSFDAPGDAARAAELRRVKMLATLVLAGTLALFVIAKALLHLHPAFGFVAAFAEAATIGGLADWYAVVALFRRPLGLPIPHTAIIQSNQQRIADKLGEFIEVHFLEAAPVEAKLRQIFENNKPDIVQTHSVKSHFLLSLLHGRQFRWIAFHHGYTNENFKAAIYRQFDKWSLLPPISPTTIRPGSDESRLTLLSLLL